MDIEQLKLILETVRGISGDAQLVAVCWIIIDKLLPMLCWMTVFFTLIANTPRIIQSTMCGTNFYKWARKELGTGIGGFLTPEEKEATESALRDLVLSRNK